MKILIVQDYGGSTGGAEIMLSTLRAGLRERGHDARAFVSNAGLSTPDDSVDFACFGTLSRFRTIVQTANPAAAWTLRSALQDFRPDVVHVRMFQTQLSPLILPLLRSIPTLYHLQWYRSICPKGTKLLPNGQTCRVGQGPACLRNGCLPLRDWIPLMVQLRLARRWHASFDAIVAVSESTRRLVEAEGIQVDSVVWNGVPECDVVSEPSPDPLVGFAGRLVAEKGVDTLVRAFAIVASREPRARLAIVGDGPERPAIERRIAELGLGSRVELTGHVSRHDVGRILGRAWVQVVPSLWEEPFGLVTAEALMRRTPVVATAVGGALEMIRDEERGLVVPPGDVRALADAIVRLLGDRILATRLAAAGHTVATRHLTPSVCVDRFVEIYERLLDRASRVASG
jgi:glycosyltransferase involved in cell wall biosynthesis